MNNGHFARDTSVSVERTRAELEKLLAKYGASAFAYATDDTRAMIGFRITGPDKIALAVRMFLPLPNRQDKNYRRTPARGYARTEQQAFAAWEQDCRSVWRALLLVVKAKLEACSVGISTIEREFMPDIVLPNGRTLIETIGADVRTMLTTGEQRPLMLPGV